MGWLIISPSQFQLAQHLPGTATGEQLQPLFKNVTLEQRQSSQPGWLIFYFLKSIARSYKVCYNSSKGWQPIKKRGPYYVHEIERRKIKGAYIKL